MPEAAPARAGSRRSADGALLRYRVMAWVVGVMLLVLVFVAVPALILAWANDPAHPLRTAELLHQTLPSSRRVVARTPYGVLAWPALFADMVTAVESGEMDTASRELRAAG